MSSGYRVATPGLLYVFSALVGPEGVREVRQCPGVLLEAGEVFHRAMNNEPTARYYIFWAEDIVHAAKVAVDLFENPM
jgi:hypothetical protein